MAERQSDAQNCYLSDVHIECSKTKVTKEGLYYTKFVLSRENLGSYLEGASNDGACRRENDELCLEIEHHLATPLESVGLQVWLGSLLLADYLVKNCDSFAGKNVVELGCGVGLVSLVAGRVSRRVFATDLPCVLDLCQRNVQRNISFCRNSGDRVLVRELDWFSDPGEVKLGAQQFHWSEEDSRQALQQVDFVLAADVAYDLDMVEALFRWLHYLLSKNTSLTVLISLEKRIVFSADTLKVASPAYDHFRECVRQLLDCNCSMHKEDCFVAHPLPIDYESIPACFTYERTGQLELWELKTAGVEKGTTPTGNNASA